MSLLVIAGSHPRHAFILSRLLDSVADHDLHIIMMRREGRHSAWDTHQIASQGESELLRMHFEGRARVEDAVYGDLDIDQVMARRGRAVELIIDPSDLNGPRVVEHVGRLKPTAALVVGGGMIWDALMRVLPERTINVHLGLSPRYRGSATMFWPHYMLEPWYVGTTFHLLSPAPDAGPVLHHEAVTLEIDMGIHETAATAVEQSADLLPALSEYLLTATRIRTQDQPLVGKTWMVRDFQPRHLRQIYEVYDDHVVRALWSSIPDSSDLKLVRGDFA